MDGVLEAGEMLVVLGPPGSGCTTMLKTIAGEMNGIYLDESSSLNYRGQCHFVLLLLLDTELTLTRYHPEGNLRPIPRRSYLHCGSRHSFPQPYCRPNTIFRC